MHHTWLCHLSTLAFQNTAQLAAGSGFSSPTWRGFTVDRTGGIQAVLRLRDQKVAAGTQVIWGGNAHAPWSKSGEICRLNIYSLCRHCSNYMMCNDWSRCLLSRQWLSVHQTCLGNENDTRTFLSCMQGLCKGLKQPRFQDQLVVSQDGAPKLAITAAFGDFDAVR